MTSSSPSRAWPQAAEPPHGVPAGIEADAEAWEEELLGRGERFVEVADQSHEVALDRAIGKLA